MGCSILEGFAQEEFNHKPKYNSDYGDMSNSEREHMSYNEEQSMLEDPAGEERWQDDLRTRRGDHLKRCDDPNCVRICNNWREHSKLSKYV